MNSYFTNIFLFTAVFAILICLLYYTKITKETFFTNSSDSPYGTIVILGGKASNGNGFNIFTNQLGSVCTFNSKRYSDYYPDLWGWHGDRNQSKKLIQHYTVHGMNEGRTPCGYENINCKWSAEDYLSFNEDVRNHPYFGKNPYQHYVQHGIHEGRSPCPYTYAPPVLKSKCPSDKSIVCPNNWRQLSGQLMSIALSPSGIIFGTDINDNILYKYSTSNEFSKINGKLKMIDTDGKYVCGVNGDNKGFCATLSEALKGNWIKIKNNCKWISISNNSAYVVNTDNSISYTQDLSDLNNVRWVSIPITYRRFHKVSLDQGKLVGISENENELYYSDRNVFSSEPTFVKMKLNSEMRNFINISLQNNTVLVTDTDYNLWYCSNYRQSDWVKMKTNTDKVFMAAQIFEQPQIQFTYNNNGTVSCDTYCFGTGGKPWGNELPVSWNGATARGNNKGITPGITMKKPEPIECVCVRTGWGWR
jgi:hypothetical protein